MVRLEQELDILPLNQTNIDILLNLSTPADITSKYDNGLIENTLSDYEIGLRYQK